MSDKPIRLTLFLKYTTTLRHQDEMGILDREFSLYRRLREKGVAINVVSHGGRDEFAYRARLPGMRLLCNWIGWSPKRYLHRLHQLHLLRLLPSNLFKTDELLAGYEATRTSRALITPLIARTGFHLSHNTRKTQPDNLRFINWTEQIEDATLNHASLVMTSTEELRRIYVKQIPSIAEKSVVIPMHVDMEQFKPAQVEKRYDLIFVGRYSDEKNVRNLLTAVKRSGVTIALIGSGPLEAALREEFGDLNGRITWLGRMKNEELPRLLSYASAFVLPSLFEGQPRAMVEAMATGLPIIGTEVMGIASTIEHEKTGYLCGTDADSIAEAIQTVLAQPELMHKLGVAARQFAMENFSLDHIAQREYELYHEVLERNQFARRSD